MRSTLVADTSVVYAALDTSDADHAACLALLASGITATIPAPVIFELDWLGRTRGRPRAVELLLESVLDGSVLVIDLDAEDYRRARELVRQYADLPLDLVDSAVIAVAERLEQDMIATLDHRHFSVVQPAHVPAFTIVP